MWQYSGDLSDTFFSKYVLMCRRVGADPIQLAKCVMLESGFHSGAKNPTSSATGLIQLLRFAPLTRDQFAALSAEDQLPRVEKYLKPYAGKLQGVGCYQAILLPASLSYASKPDDIVMGLTGPYSEFYKANIGLDPLVYGIRKGRVTIKDLSNALDRAATGPRWEEILRRLRDAMGFVDIKQGESVSERVCRIVRAYAGCSVNKNRTLLRDLVGRGIETLQRAEDVVEWRTNCATFALGVWAKAGCLHPLLFKPAVNGTAMEWVLKIARDAGAWVPVTVKGMPTGAPDPTPGDLIWYAGSNNNDHVEFLLSEIDKNGNADHGGGGRANNEVTVATGSVRQSLGRPIAGYVSVEKLGLPESPLPERVVPVSGTYPKAPPLPDLPAIVDSKVPVMTGIGVAVAGLVAALIGLLSRC